MISPLTQMNLFQEFPALLPNLPGAFPAPPSAKRSVTASHPAKVEDTFRKWAEKALSSAETKRAAALSSEPQTARQVQFAVKKLDEVEALEETHGFFTRLADSIKTRTLPPVLSGIRSKDVLETLLYLNRFPTGEGQQKLLREGITETTFAEAKSRLEELNQRLLEPDGRYALRRKEWSLVGKPIPDFFPTPAELIALMLQQADLKNGQAVLEPSGGRGDLAEAIRDTGLDLDLHVVEKNYDLRELLQLKGFKLAGHDFIDFAGSYDRILMNPPLFLS